MPARAFGQWWFISVSLSPTQKSVEITEPLRTLDWELIHAQKSWILFENSTKQFGEDQSWFLECIKANGIDEPVDHVQVIALHNVVATLCRLYDAPGSDRTCLAQVLETLTHEYGGSSKVELEKISGQREVAFHSDAFRELRNFRNSNIGHKLKETAPATYKYIPQIIFETSDMLAKMFEIANLSRWIGQPTVAGIDRRAKKFWAMLEKSIRQDGGS